MPMTGIYRDPDSNSIAYLENRRQPRRNLGSVEELYNEIENRLQQVSKSFPRV
jgi:hypothetical protein